MISSSGPAACSVLHQPVAHSCKLRERVAVTAAVRLCLFAVTLQWSTQLSAARLTAERHRVTFILYEIQRGCFSSSSFYHCHPWDITRTAPPAPPFCGYQWSGLPPQCAACVSFPPPYSFNIFVPLTNVQLCISHGVNKYSDSLTTFPQTLFVCY